MTNRTKVLITTSLAVLTLGVFLLWRKYPPPEQNPSITHASKGELVAEFPKELLLNPSEVVDSYGIAYQDRNQYTVVYRSEKGVKDIYGSYKKYLLKAGYLLTSERLEAEQAWLYGAKDNSDCNVLIRKEGQQVLITTSYVKK